MVPFKPSWQPFALNLKSQMSWRQSCEWGWVSWRGTWRWMWWKERKRKRHFYCFLANNRMTVPQMYSSAFHIPMYFIILDLVCNLPNFMLMKKCAKFVKKGSDINQQTKPALLSIQLNFRWLQFWPTGWIISTKGPIIEWKRKSIKEKWRWCVF